MKSKPTVQILLSTYNGQLYLRDFIDSIESMDFDNLSILVRDDNSSDGTSLLLDLWLKNSRHTIEFIDFQNKINIGWRSSFDRLIKSSTADIICFADQDDIWHSDKISKIISEISSQDPQLVVHNADIIIDDNSLIKNNILLGFKSIPKIIPSSIITGGFYGCCIGVNRALLNQYMKFDHYHHLGHDYLLTILALSSGDIKHVDTPLVSWRSHEHNSSCKVGFLNRFNQLQYLYSISKFELAVAFPDFKPSILKVVSLFNKKLLFVLSRKLSKLAPAIFDRLL